MDLYVVIGAGFSLGVIACWIAYTVAWTGLEARHAIESCG